MSPNPVEHTRELSIVTLGNSVAFMRIPHSQEAGNYTDVAVNELANGGIPARAVNESRWFDFVTNGVDEYEARVRPYRPDVLIINYGLNESQPWLAPRWLVAHLLRDATATTRSGVYYREHVASRLWHLVRGFRRRTSSLVGMRTWQMTPYRFERALNRLIFIARAERPCLVLVVDINPPGGVLTHFLPGQSERHAYYQELLAKIVRQCNDSNVRLVRSSQICAQLGIDHALPDGMHLSSAAHHLLGQAIAEEIRDWRSGIA